MIIDKNGQMFEDRRKTDKAVRKDKRKESNKIKKDGVEVMRKK